MVLEAVRDNQISIDASISESKRKTPVIQRVLDDQEYFESYYKSAGKNADYLQRKYELAKALIEDGRYHKRRLLVEQFIPSEVDIKLDDLELATTLKGELALLLIKTGDVSTTSEEARAAEKVVADKFEHSALMDTLVRQGVTVEVLGQIVTVEECVGMTDEKKLEEFRSWATHAILRPYIGKLSGKRPDRDSTILDLADRIPAQVFSHPYIVKYNLLANYFAGQMRKCVNEMGSEEAIRQIEEEVQQAADLERRKFLEDVYEEVYDDITYPYKGDFKDIIQVKGKDRTFPCVEQATFCRDGMRYNTRLCVADPGLGKTNTGYLYIENTDAENALVVAPAQVRPVWREQDNVVFRNPGNVFLIEGSGDIEAALAFPNKYVAVSRELLGRTSDDPSLMSRLEELVLQRRIDGSIIDEIHNFTNPNAASTRALRRLLEVIHQNYKVKTGKETAPVIGLTATPIRKSVADLNVPMAMLYPTEYAATPAEATVTKKTFSDACLRSPHLTYIALTGEHRMFRWESGSHEFDYDTLAIKASPFEDLLADFINTEVGGDALNKIRLIENAYFNPLLVKNEVMHLLKGKVPEIDIDEAIDTLKKTLVGWKRMRGVNTPVGEKDYLSADRLVELGLGRVVLGCFFSGLPDGIDSLVNELAKDIADPVLVELGTFWMPREISTKYNVIREQLEKSLTWMVNEDGSLGREKIVVISPARKQGRTGDVLQREVSDGNGSKTALYKEDDLDKINDTKLVGLIRSWVQKAGLCSPEGILLLDGTVTGSKREDVIARFANDPQAAVLVLTLEAAYQGRDFTLNNIVDQYGRKIIGVHNLFIGPTWDRRQMGQMIGRFVRQEHLVPARNTVLEIEDSAEQGKGEVVRFTYLLDRIVLSGATLHQNDQEFLDSKRVGPRVLRYRNPDTTFLRDVFGIVKGKSVEEIQTFLNKKEAGQEKTNAARMAERFYDEGRDAYKTTGYNAEMVALLVTKFSLDSGQILSLGAGTLLLQRKLKRGIDNVDLNSYMMEEGWREAQSFGGKTFERNAASLEEAEFPDQTYDFLDSAFALDWTALGNVESNAVDKSVRVQALSQMNRVLKNGGMLALTLPEKTLNDERLISLIKALEENFGFKVDRNHSGKSYGISRFGTTKRLGWCIVAQKVGPLDLTNLNLRDLEFCIDNREWISNLLGKQNGGSGPVREDPSPDVRLNFEHYRIVGADGEETDVEVINGEEGIVVHANGSETIEDIGKEDKGGTKPRDNDGIDITFLRGSSRDDFRSFKKDLIKPLTKITGLNWTQAEDYGINLLQETIKKSKLPQNRVIAYAWILKEAKRRLKGNQ